MKNFSVTSKAEDGNIFNAKVIANPPAAPKAATVPPEAGGIENQEAQASIFDDVVTLQPGRVTLTLDDLVDLWARGLEIDDN